MTLVTDFGGLVLGCVEADVLQENTSTKVLTSNLGLGARGSRRHQVEMVYSVTNFNVCSMCFEF